MGNSVNCNSYNFNENKNERNAESKRNEIKCNDIFYCCCKRNEESYFNYEEENEKNNRIILKKKILTNQKLIRNQQQNIFKPIGIFQNKEQETNLKINKTLEDMCIYGNIMKEEIQREKKENPYKFIEIDEALKYEEKDQTLFALGLLADNLRQIGMEVAIEKEQNKTDNELDEGTTAFQFISNGMI